LSNTISDFIYETSISGLRNEYITYLLNLKESETKILNYLLSTKSLLLKSSSELLTQIKSSKDLTVLEKYNQLENLDKNV